MHWLYDTNSPRGQNFKHCWTFPRTDFGPWPKLLPRNLVDAAEVHAGKSQLAANEEQPSLPKSADFSKASAVACILSRRDSMIVARHEYVFSGVLRGRAFAPKGLDDSARGFNQVSTPGTIHPGDAPSQGATPLRPREKHPARPGWGTEGAPENPAQFRPVSLLKTETMFVHCCSRH
jgi:hypothetical protein